MARLDETYVTEIVNRAKTGDANAFAEMYAATCDRQYLFSYCYLGSDEAKDALKETYVLALNGLYTLHDPKLFVSWLNQINFRVCNTRAKRTSDNEMIPYLLALPFSEGQILFLHKVRGLSLFQVADLLESNIVNVSQHLHSGEEHLADLMKKGGTLK